MTRLHTQVGALVLAAAGTLAAWTGGQRNDAEARYMQKYGRPYPATERAAADQQRDRATDGFSRMDRNNDGMISREEWRAAQSAHAKPGAASCPCCSAEQKQ